MTLVVAVTSATAHTLDHLLARACASTHDAISMHARYPPTMGRPAGGMMSDDPSQTMFADWALLYVNYCDGGSFTGLRADPVRQFPSQHHHHHHHHTHTHTHRSNLKRTCLTDKIDRKRVTHSSHEFWYSSFPQVIVTANVYAYLR
jgi:hypothetical protein